MTIRKIQYTVLWIISFWAKWRIEESIRFRNKEIYGSTGGFRTLKNT